MTATLKLTHRTIGVEVRRGTYDVVLDGEPAGSLQLNDPIEIPVEPGHHTLQVRNGRNSSGTETFDAVEGETVAFRCGGKRILAIFLLSFAVPSLALSAQARVGESPRDQSGRATEGDGPMVWRAMSFGGGAGLIGCEHTREGRLRGRDGRVRDDRLRRRGADVDVRPLG
jgi:hypothetical protein